MPVRKDIPELTSLRFFAALAVLLSHLHGLGFIQAERLHEVLDGGRTAVAFFFVLSGFVLTLRYPASGIGSHYRLARFARIYPTHLLALAIGIPSTLYLAYWQPDEAAAWFMLKGPVTTILVISFLAQLLLLTAWIPFAAINQQWNGPAWSLSCEAFFYTLFPWLRRGLTRFTSRQLVGALLGGWILQATFIALMHRLVPEGRAVHLIYQCPVPHLFEFVAGIVCGIAYERGSLERLGQASRPVLALCVVAIALLSWFQPVVPAYLLQAPFFALAIAAIAASPRPSKILSRPELVTLGASSFALYMIHVPILTAIRIVAPSALPGWVLAPVLVALSVVVFLNFEEPLRRRILRRERPAAA